MLSDEALCNAALHFKELLETELRQQEQTWVFPDATWPGQTSDAFASWGTEHFDDYNVAVVDTACMTTLHGKDWGDKFREHLVTYGVAWQEVRIHVFVNGVGGKVLCSKAVRWPVGIYGVAGEIVSLEIGGSVPSPFSRPAQEKLGFHLHAKQATVDIEALDVYDAKLVRTSKGHFALPLLQFPDQHQ